MYVQHHAQGLASVLGTMSLPWTELTSQLMPEETEE
jgi:hypothetical protein